MRKSLFTKEQMAGILREAERGEKTIPEIGRYHRITEQAFYRSKQK